MSAICLSATGVYGQLEPSSDQATRALVRQSIQNYENDWRAARMKWAYTQTDITQSDGAKEISVSEVAPLNGTPYERLIGKDGHPLTAVEQRKEDRKYERVRHQREKETAAEREARIRKYESEREFIREIPEAYNFKLLGEETVEGRPAWVIGMTPRPDYTPTTMRAGMLRYIQGKLWIDKEDVQWAKADAHVVDRISFGWILARIEPGTQFHVEQTRVENGIWMPRRITIAGAAHVMMLYTKPIDEELTYSGYRKEGSVSAEKLTGGASEPGAPN